MKIYLPSLALQPFVRHFMITEAKGDIVNRVLPNASLTMAFRLKGQVNEVAEGIKNKMPLSLISGLRKSNRLIHYTENAANIIVHFKEGAAVAFIKEPLHELAGQSLSLDYLNGYKNVSHLEEQLNESTNNKDQILLVEQFLLSRLHDYKPDSLITHSLEIIQQQNGVVRIKELTGSLCISQDAFEKRFRKSVGASPKQYAYLVRMRTIIEKGIAMQSLAETAYQAGYFDQSHFNKDFKLFTGLTPSEFIRSREGK
jgi:AraC-like DNA-binding protein